jgi:hypothetical protein
VADDTNPVLVAAEVLGSGSENEHFITMVKGLTGQMHRLRGKDKPLERVIVVGDTGYFTDSGSYSA